MMEEAYRQYKGRVVCLGNSVIDQCHDEATFRDMVSSPAAKAAALHGCLHGQVIEIADVEQAYVQAEMNKTSTPTWVCLPLDQRPAMWKEKFPNARKPVCRLLRALCGHPGAATYLGRTFS